MRSRLQCLSWMMADEVQATLSPLLCHILSTVRSLHSQWFTRVSSTLTWHFPCLLACDPACSLSFLDHVPVNLPSSNHSTVLLCSLFSRQISIRVHFFHAPCYLYNCPLYFSLVFAPSARSDGWELNSQLQQCSSLPFLETVNLRQKRKWWKSSIMAVMMIPWALQLLLVKGPPARAKNTYRALHF